MTAPMQSIDLVPTLGAMMGFSPSLSQGKTDQGIGVVLCFHAISKPSSSPDILLRQGALAVAHLGCAAAASAQLCCRACCGRSSTTISSSPPSARPSIRSWLISVLFLRRRSKSGFRRSLNFRFLRSWSISTGSISRPSLSNSYRHTFGPLTNWMRFEKQRPYYGDRLRSAVPPEPIPVRRLGIAVIGQGVASYDAPLFRNLREHGTYFGRVKPENGLELLLTAAAARAKAHPVPYGHWYVDGGQEADHSPLLTCVSYQALQPVRAALLKNMQTEIGRPGMGPEELRTHLARLSPSDLGMDKAGDAVLDRFQVKLLTEGSGTQIFSTTFAQWTAREVLRRAQALTLLVRFAPRQRQRPMNELLSNSHGNPELDFTGSLVDADMGAYYHWINQQRLPGSEQSSFLVWFEGHSQALAIAPSLPRGTHSRTRHSISENCFPWATA